LGDGVGRSARRWRAAKRCALPAAIAFLLPFIGPAAAGDAPRFEINSGTDATANSTFGYAGGVWAPGPGLDAPGWRIKALGGYGAYAYDGTLAFAGTSVPVRFQGQAVSGELLAGRAWFHGPWALKAYAGIQFTEHAISPNDPGNAVNGAEWGAKGQIEFWRDLGNRNWLSADASYGAAFGDYFALAKLGHRMSERISLGIEGGGLGNEAYDAGRGGAFVRLHVGGAEITLSGGVTGDYRGEDTSGYVSVGFYRKR
jgi:hypothetical protein